MKDHGPKGTATALPSDSNELGEPAPLKEKLLVIQEGNATVLLDPSQDVSTAPTATADLVTGYVTDFPKQMATGGITPGLIKNVSVGVQLLRERIDVPLEPIDATTPDNADTLLRPAVTATFKFEAFLREEAPGALRKENLPLVRTAVDLIDGYTEIIDIVEPFYLGLLGRRRQAQVVVDGFCRRIYRTCSVAIQGNSILRKGLVPLETLCTTTSVQAQVTAHLKGTLAHDIEQEVMTRVEQELLRQAAAQQPSGTTPLSGAHAPGQVAVPPGALPITLPAPQHPKPKRRGTTSPPPKKGPAGSPAPKKKTKKGG